MQIAMPEATTISFACLALICGYLAGSLSAAIITCRLLGLTDPRHLGSGNPGATNVLRFGGKKAALITLVGDTLKGLVPILIVNWLLTDDSLLLPVCAGAGAFLGHLFPVFFKFRGGKGVATALGVLLGLSWPTFSCVIATWLIMAVAFRYSALAALTGFALAPLYIAIFSHSALLTTVMAAISALIFWRHQSNISNLLQGKESKIGEKA